MADLSKEKGPEPFPPWAFIRFIRIGIQIKLINHLTLSGRKGQTIHNLQRTLRAYSELWSIS